MTRSHLLIHIMIGTLFLGCKKEEAEEALIGGTASSPVITGTITDVDGNTYETVVLGTQEWTTENLRTTHYRNGDPIPNVTESEAWSQLNTGAWCHYENNPVHNDTYGKLYNWFAVTDPRSLCPQGWHVPTDDDWKVFETTLGMPPPTLNDAGIRGEEQNVGGKMKSTGTTHWLNVNVGATNESMFSGLPGGQRNANGEFGRLGYDGCWWSSSEGGNSGAWYRILFNYTSGRARMLQNRQPGYCVRCIKD